MRTLYYKLTVMLLAFATVVNAQQDKKNTAYKNLFSKGTVSFSNIQNLYYTNFKGQVNGDPKSYGARIDPNIFIIDGLAVGIDARFSGNSSKNLKSKYNYWQTNLTLTYGHNIIGALNTYLKLSAGTGHSRSEFTNGNSAPQILTAKYTDLKGTLAFPIALESNSAASLTPYFSYDYSKTHTVSNDYKDKTFGYGVKLESYIQKGMGAGKMKDDIQKNAYKQGANFIEFTSLAGATSNTRQQIQNGGNTLFAKQKNKNTNIGLGYNYYIINDVAVGLNFSYGSTKTGYVGTTSSKNSTVMFGAVVTGQIPVEGPLHHLFAQAAYSFGTYKEPKKNLTDFSIKAGYNIFLTRYLTFTPRIGYEIQKAKIPSGVSGIPYEDKGLSIDMGVRTWLNLWK